MTTSTETVTIPSEPYVYTADPLEKYRELARRIGTGNPGGATNGVALQS